MSIELFLAGMLGPALFKVGEMLVQQGVINPALKTGLEPLQTWVTAGYDQAKHEEALIKAGLAALNSVEYQDQGQRVRLTNRLTGLAEDARKMLAASAVEMVQPVVGRLPTALIEQLGVGEGDLQALADFLFQLRENLLKVNGFEPLLDYSNQMESLGLLRGLGRSMEQMIELQVRTASYLEILVKERGLAGTEQDTLQAFLEKGRRDWGSLMLPLIRKRSGQATTTKLKHVYVPLKMRDLREEERRRAAAERKLRRRPDQTAEPEEHLPPAANMVDLLRRHQVFILLGAPGSGKTTLLRRTALAFAEGRARQDLGWDQEELLPIFFRLRNFSTFLIEHPGKFSGPSSGAILAYLEDHYREGERIDTIPRFFDNRLREGGCLVLMDGLDEVVENRVEVAQHVNVFIEAFRNSPRANYFGLSSRPKGYEGDAELQLSAANLAVAEVYPLAPDGIRQLIGNIFSVIDEDPEQVETDTRRLVQAILRSQDLVDIAGVPLFCSALVQVYKYQGSELPQRKVDVLDEIVNLLLGYWHAQQASQIDRPDELVKKDGTERDHRDIKSAVDSKLDRLVHLANYMYTELQQVEISRKQAQKVLAEYFQSEERVKDEEVAYAWADNFLYNSHERSGLLAESRPGMYEFVHKNFLEYFAATARIQKLDLEALAQAHIMDDWWEQVILLAGAHPNTPKIVRNRLVRQTLPDAGLEKVDGEWLRRLTMAGRLVRDMAGHLGGPEREMVEDALLVACTRPDLKPKVRAGLAVVLDEIYLPPDLGELVLIGGDGHGEPFYITRYPVTNIQYKAFLMAKDYQDPELWQDLPKFKQDGKRSNETWGQEGLVFLENPPSYRNREAGGMLYPLHWHTTEFGVTKRTGPVVGVSWFEASAFCKWLEKHWTDDGLPVEMPDLLNGKRIEIRLPTEGEWQQAVGIEGNRNKTYAWSQPGEALDSDADLWKRANTAESGIGCTTPVSMYPLGVSQPYGLYDMTGNVWEWMANFSDKEKMALAVRGGSWNDIRYFVRRSGHLDPNLSSSYLGFRVVVLPSAF